MCRTLLFELRALHDNILSWGAIFHVAVAERSKDGARRRAGQASNKSSLASAEAEAVAVAASMLATSWRDWEGEVAMLHTRISELEASAVAADYSVPEMVSEISDPGWQVKKIPHHATPHHTTPHHNTTHHTTPQHTTPHGRHASCRRSSRRKQWELRPWKS